MAAAAEPAGARTVGGLTPVGEVRKVLKSCLDNARFSELWNLKCELLGVPEEQRNRDVQVGVVGGWALFPDIESRWVDVGVAGKVMDAAFTVAARFLSSVIETEWKGLNPVKRDVLTGYVEQRVTTATKEASFDVAMAALEGVETGAGGCQVGMEDAASGLQRTCVKFQDNTRFLVDPRFVNPTDGRFVAFMEPMPADLAYDRYKGKIDGKTVTMQALGGSQRWEVVPLVCWYDRGLVPSDAPSYYVFAKDMDGAPVEDGPNPYGEIRPLALSWGLTLPGQRYPTGAIKRQLPVAEQMRRMDGYFRNRAEGPVVVFVDLLTSQQDDMESLIARWRQDYNVHVVRRPMPPGQPVAVMPLLEVSQTMLEYEAQLRQDWAEVSFSSIDRNQSSEGGMTKYEFEQRAARADANQGNTQWQTQQFVKRLVEMIVRIGAMWDRDPFVAEVLGEDLLVNDPRRPESWLDKYTEPDGRALVGRSALTPLDDARKREAKMGKIERIAASAPGAVSQQKVLEEMVKAAGDWPDADDWKAVVGQVMDRGSVGAPAAAP